MATLTTRRHRARGNTSNGYSRTTDHWTDRQERHRSAMHALVDQRVEACVELRVAVITLMKVSSLTTHTA